MRVRRGKMEKLMDAEKKGVREGNEKEKTLHTSPTKTHRIHGALLHHAPYEESPS